MMSTMSKCEYSKMGLAVKGKKKHSIETNPEILDLTKILKQQL